MELLTPELIRKHVSRLIEASTTVKAHTRRSKKGKVFNVKQYQRDLEDIANAIVNKYAFGGDKAVIKSFLFGKISAAKALKQIRSDEWDRQQLANIKYQYTNASKGIKRA